jgi:hypothetical protein
MVLGDSKTAARGRTEAGSDTLSPTLRLICTWLRAVVLSSQHPSSDTHDPECCHNGAQQNEESCEERAVQITIGVRGSSELPLGAVLWQVCYGTAVLTCM